MSELDPGLSPAEMSPELKTPTTQGRETNLPINKNGQSDASVDGPFGDESTEPVDQTTDDDSDNPEDEQGEVTPRPELRVRHETFEEAQQAEKKFSDTFIDNVLAAEAGDPLPFLVGTEHVGLKGYLDKVEATDKDEAILDDPEAIAGVYVETTDMIARNLRIKVAKGTQPDRVQEIATAKEAYMSGLKDEALANADKIVDWCEDADQRKSPRPGEAFGYYGFKVGDTDALAWGEKGASDFHPNIKIQRQGGGNFIFGYSDARVSQRMAGNRDTLDQRIYLNPDIMASPQIFEKVLAAANETGMTLELKMLQRSEELGAAHILKSRNPNNGDALRGDGIVIYAPSESANDVLELVLAVAKDHAEAFSDRQTSRIPQTVADGIAVGSEPAQQPGKDAESLTSHRTKVIETIARKIVESGKTGQEARDAFRRGVEYYGKREQFNPKNIAF